MKKLFVELEDQKQAVTTYIDHDDNRTVTISMIASSPDPLTYANLTMLLIKI
jgi:hypothetical protein